MKEQIVIVRRGYWLHPSSDGNVFDFDVNGRDTALSSLDLLGHLLVANLSATCLRLTVEDNVVAKACLVVPVGENAVVELSRYVPSQATPEQLAAANCQSIMVSQRFTQGLLEIQFS